MVFPKYRPAPPPKNRLIIENRIIDGKMRKVETYNGKVARVYGSDGKLIEDRSTKLKIILPTPPLEPKIRRKPEEPSREDMSLQETSQEDKQMDESPILELPNMSTPAQTARDTGENLQLVPEDDIATPIDVYNEHTQSTEDIKEEKIDTEQNVEELSNIKESIDPGLSQQDNVAVNIQGTSINQQPNKRKEDIPKIENQEKSPRKKIIQKEIEMGIPGVPIKSAENRINKLIDNKTSNIQTVPNIQTTQNIQTTEKTTNKIAEIIKAEQQPIEDKITKENKNMVEELLEEYKREKWAKKRDFEKNIEDMARVASENKGQIKEISQQIAGVTGKVGDVEEQIGGLQNNIQDRLGTLQQRLGDVKKPVSDTLGELCDGIDCIKTDLKKSQEFQQSADKQIDGKFKELSDRLQKLEEPTYVCDNCGQDDIRPLSSFCPNCGSPIHSWTDPDTGNPVSGWSPFWKRGQKYQIQE